MNYKLIIGILRRLNAVLLRVYVWFFYWYGSAKGFFAVRSSLNRTVRAHRSFGTGAVLLWSVASLCVALSVTRVPAATYYLNDGNATGDVYTTAIGNDANSGLSNAAPKLTLTNLLASYTLAAGDVVYIDTGLYTNYTTLIAFSGAATNPIVFQGSTNINAGGSVFDRRLTSADVLSLNNANYLHFRDLIVRGGRYGVSIGNSLLGDTFTRVYAISNSVGFRGGNASNHRFDRCAAINNTTGFESFNFNVVWESGVMWGNGSAFRQSFTNTVAISNSIIVGGTAYLLAPAVADFNVYHQTALGAGLKSLSDLQRKANNSYQSTFADPQLVDPAGLDFHLRSVVGRFTPSGGIETDAVHSVAIDLGDPSRDYSQETMPNGSRMNIGVYGNRPSASRSRTNTWLYAVSFNDGGNFFGTGTLYWAGGAFTNNATVRLDYSPDNGVSWSNIVMGVPATNYSYAWSATGAVSSLRARWRVLAEGGGAGDTNDVWFSLRPNGTNSLAVYVNDASTAGDVYTTAIGSDANHGTTPAYPLYTLQAALDRYYLEGGDIIYLDSGLYTNTVTVGFMNQGMPGNPFIIRGSTNLNALSIVDPKSGVLDGFTLSSVQYIRTENIAVQNSRYGVRLQFANNCEFENILSVSNLAGYRGDSSSFNVFQRCAAVGNATGFDAFNVSNTWERGVSYMNTKAFQITAPSALSVSNSIIQGGTAFVTHMPYAFDYNMLYDTAIGGGYNNLYDYQKTKNGGWGSTFADPMFANPGGYNFHFMSKAGRFDPSTASFVTDAVHSAAIDFGDPSRPVGSETSPNGNRINLGIHGGTAFASRSLTNQSLLALSLQDGGQLTVGDSVRWDSYNLSTSATVRIEYSGDGGISWNIVGTNIAASSGMFVWTSTNYPSSYQARWRVVLESQPSILSSNNVNFTFRNGVFVYYLNDDSLVGDVFTSAIGNDANPGSTPATPKANLATLLGDVDLEPGDVVYIDTGRYKSATVPQIGAADSGNATNPVYLIFSSNGNAGGAVFDRGGGGLNSIGLSFVAGAAHIEVQNPVITNSPVGFQITSATNIVIKNAVVHSAVDSAFRLNNANLVRIENSAAYLNATNGVKSENSVGVQIRDSVFWRNGASQIRVDGGAVSVTGTIIVASGPRAAVYQAASTTNIVADYNGIYAESNAMLAIVGTVTGAIDRMGAWQYYTSQDRNSVPGDPLFGNPAAGDFHLRSQTPGGRFDPSVDDWVTDPDHSPLIDAGAPMRSASNEPLPNGGRINIGLYANTTEASLGRSSPWLIAASHRQGGWVTGTATLHWVAGNIPTNSLVRIEYSPNGGETWSVLSTGIVVSAEALSWNTYSVSNTAAALWRVTSLADTNVSDSITNLFMIRNGPMAFYLNDADTVGDNYSTGPGSATNWVATAARPFNSLSQFLSRYDIEAGDVVYIDTGMYSENAAAVISPLSSGVSNNPVQLRGPTNGLSARISRGDSASGSFALSLSYARWVAVSNVVFQDANVGVHIADSADLSLSLSATANAANGVEVLRSTNVLFRRTVVDRNQGMGIFLLTNPVVRVEQSVIWSNAGGGVRLRTSSAQISNSVLLASSQGTYLFTSETTNDTIQSDYNDLLAVGGAQVGMRGGRAYRFVVNWQAETGLDRNSLAHDPLFVDPDAGDYHVFSQAGRFVPGGSWVEDLVTSPLIDAGDPLRSFSAELNPNGARMNLGQFGDHWQASKSPTNARLLAISLNDGGAVRGTNALRWVAHGVATGHAVRIEFSADSGASWTTVVSGISAALGIYTNWDTTVHGSTVLGSWRVVSEVDTNVFDAADELFALNNGPLSYYVNDLNTAGDVYCTAPGSDVNDGASPATPALTVQQILNRYAMNSGDRILVDTGVYPLESPITFDSGVVGEATNRITLQGSTNYGAGGTIFDAQRTNRAIIIQQTKGIELRDFSIKEAQSAIYLLRATNAVVDNVTVIGAKGFRVLVYGIQGSFVNGAIFRGTSVSGITNASGEGAALQFEDSSGIQWLSGVLWSNRVSMSLVRSSVVVSNSSFSSLDPMAEVYIADRSSSISSDYNNYHLSEGAQMGRTHSDLLDIQMSIPTYYDTLFTWVRFTGNDKHSLSHDPLFADPDAEDYHLMSEAGRFVPGTGWAMDAATSPLIDAGSPSDSFVEESSPNGGRKNIGRYGNTSEASRSPSGSRLTALSLNDGGIASGTNVALRWLALGPVTNHSLRIDISYDNGLSWSGAIFGISANSTTTSWNSTSWLSLPNIRWRVQSQSDTNIVDANDRWFQIRNTNLAYYVNDSSTNGDIYTTQAGFETYSGLAPDEPLPDLADVLSRYDLEPGDWIYVDTGEYTATQQVRITSLASGANETNWMTIVGSTNELVGGSILRKGIRLDGARDVRIEGFSIQGSAGVKAAAFQTLSSSNIEVRKVHVSGGWGNAFAAQQSGDIRFDRSVAQGAVTNGLYDDRSFRVSWKNGVLWSNAVGVRSESFPGEGYALSVSNTVIGAVHTGQVAISVGSNYVADFNAVFVTNGAEVVLQGVQGRVLPTRYDSLARWSLDTGRDPHSLVIDPLFADEGTDFHLLSEAGRFSAISNAFLNDSVTSWLIDAGDPIAPYANESEPNGGRKNIGLYGNTSEASRTPTNSALLAVSLRDGGIAQGTNQVLHWLARGAATGHTVRIEFSPDNGLSWTTLVSGVAANSGFFTWNTTNTPSTVLGLWRVVSESETNVVGVSPRPFAVRHGPISFYVNDASTNGDIYCSAPGADANYGVSPLAPMRSIQKLLDAYDLEPGDTVYVDTGVYSNSAPLRLAQGDSGSVNPFVPVRIVGSTNYPAGGSVLVATGIGGNTIEYFDVRAVLLKDFTIKGSSVAHVNVNRSEKLWFERIHTVGARYGYQLNQLQGAQWENCISRDYLESGVAAASSSSLAWDMGVMWSAGTNAFYLNQSGLTVSNSALSALSSNSLIYYMDSLSILSSDFNNIWLTNSATMALQTLPSPMKYVLRWEYAAMWSRDTGNDRFSLSVDPLFNDPAQGDFHLKSSGGRYDLYTGTFVNDPVSSPLLDAAYYLADFSAESMPNGSRANIGAFGGTPWASRSPAMPMLQVVSLNDGGIAAGTVQPLYWVATGLATGHTVSIELSTDNGVSWTVLQSNLPGRIVSPQFWNTTTTNSTAVAYWRVVSEQATSAVSTVQKPFAIRNAPLSFYVNDTSTSGDVYTATSGSPLHHGASPDYPRDTVQSILDDYDLEPGDTVYVDTGVYPLTEQGIRWGRFDAWDAVTNAAPLISGVSVTLQGSTNYAGGGSQFTAYQVDPAFSFAETFGVAVRDISIRQLVPSSATGIHLSDSPYMKFYRVETRNGGTGFFVDKSTSVTFSNSIARGNSKEGLRTLEGDNTRWYNGLLWSNRYAINQRDIFPAELRVENTVIGVWGSGAFAYYLDQTPNQTHGKLLADYNNIYRNNDAFVGAIILPVFQGGGTTRYEHVTAWMQATTNDQHTLSGDPLFAGADDFHPQSYAGRYEVGTGYITNVGDALSPLIDAGRPASPFNREPAPNGLRANIGPFANTEEASKTPTTNGDLRTITFNDGGTDEGEIMLRWSASGVVTGHLIRIEFSSNGGGSWVMVHTGIAASVESYLWDSAPYGRAAAGLWRITSVEDAQISDTSDKYFSLRNGGSIPYYVNDNSTAGDVYCTVPGNDLYDGYLPSTPKATLQVLLDAIDLEPGDIVYVDTGTYMLSSAVEIGDLDAGTTNRPVIIQGSTNRAVGGTVFNRQTGSGTALRLFQTAGIHVRDLNIINSGVGVMLDQVEGVRVTDVRSENAGISAFSAVKIADSEFVRCVAAFSTNGLTVGEGVVGWNNGVIYGTVNPFILDALGSVRVNNSYTRAVGSSSRVYWLTEGAGSIVGDYNAYDRSEGAMMFERVRSVGGNEVLPRLSDWQAVYTQDLHSLSHDPLLVNPDAGDFTPKSGTGRFLSDGTLTNDPSIFSPLLDTGNPLTAWTNELAPNGARINIGHLGDTPRASMSATNPWLLALSFNDGGTLKGTTTVYWASGGMTNGTRVRLEHALDGVDFVPFATNILASQGSATWDVSALPVTPLARWRVVCEGCSAQSQNSTPIMIKNNVLVLYVNDGSTNGDVYATAAGSATNDGQSASHPLDSPQRALDRYTLGPDDVVYIDTGVYSLTNDVGLYVGLSASVMETGISNHPIRIIGSTNYAAGGTQIIGVGGTNSYGLQISGTAFVEAEHLRISAAGYGISVDRAQDVLLKSIELSDNEVAGISVSQSSPVRIDRATVWANQGYGLYAASLSLVTADRSIFWSNRLGGVALSTATFRGSNSIHVANATNTYAFRLFGVQNTASGDYNIYWGTNGAQIAFDQGRQVYYRNLRAWQAVSESEEHSAYFDPRFASPEQGDFHLRSFAGRFDGASWVADPETSWAIDAANPLADSASEPLPNGARMNAGVFGNTPEASKSETNASERALKIISFDDGGLMPGAQYLRWLARAYSPTDLVTIAFSPNAGVSWITIATNVPATLGEYYWSPDPTNSSPITMWRITSESGVPQSVTNGQYFALRLMPITFYINDNSTVGDIYSMAVGGSSNDGLTPLEPMDSLAALVERYDLEGGDQILVDTGYYLETNTVRLTALHAGNATSRVYITGSTNWLEGGTTLNHASMFIGSLTNSDPMFEFYFTRFIDVSHFTVVSGNVGVLGYRGDDVVISNVVVRDGGLAGFSFKEGNRTHIGHSIVANMRGYGLEIPSGDVTFDSGIIWSNLGSAFSVGGTLRVTNSVLHATGTNRVYALGELAAVQSDYNNLFLEGGARPAIIGTLDIEGLLQWSLASENDRHSIALDPGFADPGNFDFHPRSPLGRFDPTLQQFVTTDVEYSPLIDMGPPFYVFTNELAPNGGKRNIGIHGNTSDASKGRTNAWLMALTGSAGGRGNGLIPLTWAWGQMNPTNRVSLDFSYDNGTNWVRIASNQLVTTEFYLWESTLSPFSVTPIARYRVVLDADTNVWDMTDTHFALNGPFSFYLNDDSLVDDVFTTSVGSDSNLGFYPHAPMRTLLALLETWDVDPGDSVFIDTGIYPIASNTITTIGGSDSGRAGELVYFSGSTNGAGASFEWQGPPNERPTILVIDAPYLVFVGGRFKGGGLEATATNQTLQNMTFTNASIEISGVDTVASNIVVDIGSYKTFGANQTHSRILIRNGVIELGGSDVLMENSLAYGTQTVAATASGTNIVLINNTFVSARDGVVLSGGDASLTLRNNTIVGNGLNGEAHVIRIDSGALDSDYNNLVARNGAWIGNANGKWERLLYWQRASMQDHNSISADPLFADELNSDFHPKSLIGRWTPSGWVTDAVHAATIDLGAPYLPFNSEPLPHGSRANIGAYGNTEQASKSLVDPWLFAMTMNDGGVFKGTNALRWASGNLTNGATVTLRYSQNQGLSWTNIATGVDASDGQYIWDSTLMPSSFGALWEIVLEGDTNVRDKVDMVFALRNVPQNFYVNDGSLSGDVYTTAVGAPANHGRTPSLPKDSLASLLAQYDTEGGDVIYIDTGIYNLTENTTVIWSRGGDPTNGPLWIWGSTNFAAGGSVLSRGSFVQGSASLDIKASHVRARNLTLRQGRLGALLDSNTYVTIERSRSVSNQIGVAARHAFRPTVQNNIFLLNASNAVELSASVSNTVQNNVFYDNPISAIAIISNSSPNLLQNNIFSMGDVGAVAYTGVFNVAFVDYNVYHFRTNNTRIFGAETNLLRWQLQTERDYRSAVTNPLFANASAGDFHLLSTLGRWAEGTGFVVDAQSSWAIDRGSTNSLYELEPLPNGARINIGAYGNTEYASKGLASTQALVETRILNSPTFIGETNATWPLIWGTINIPSNELFRVEFSGDGGTNWYILSNNVPAYQEYIVWNASPFFNTYKGRWRIVGENNTNYWDINDAQFQLFFGTFRVSQVFYDQITNGIVFRGAWAEQYQVQWATNLVGSNFVWRDAFDGAGPQEKASFLSTNGGDFTYRDRESVTNRYRLYRVLREW